MELKNFFAQDDQGNSLGEATCYLYARGTESLATGLQAANGTALANPFTSDATGLIQFAAPNGLYDLRVVKGARDYRVRVQCLDVEESVAEAESAAVRAEVARDAAQLSAGVFADTAAGLAATTIGKYFSVPSAESSEFLVLYRNNAGVAQEVKRYPSSELLAGITQGVTPDEYDGNGVKLRTWDEDGNMVVSGRVMAEGKFLAALPYGADFLEGGAPAFVSGDGIFPLSFDQQGRMLAVPHPIFARMVAMMSGAQVDMDAIVSQDSIVLFGDSITASGSGWGDNLAAALGGSRSVTNKGVGGEDTKTIVQRQGGYPIPLAAFTLPASGSVTVTLTDGDPYYGKGGTYAATVSGIAVTAAPTATFGQWTLTRVTAGNPVAVASGTPIVLTEQEGFRVFTLVLQPGPNLNPAMPSAMKRHELQPYIDIAAGAIVHLTPKVKRFSLVGEYVAANGTDRTNLKASILLFNSMLRQLCGEAHYIDLHEWGSTQAIYDGVSLGVIASVTAQDEADMAAGLVPQSLTVDGVHPNPTFKQLLARRVATNIKLKGI